MHVNDAFIAVISSAEYDFFIGGIHLTVRNMTSSLSVRSLEGRLPTGIECNFEAPHPLLPSREVGVQLSLVLTTTSTILKDMI